ncbi:response regulator [Desulfovibrio sp. OttesenSCG-928-A18]|nr:response regulator [Desulfovibrio sp. OttesenSCG-928-A18]
MLLYKSPERDGIADSRLKWQWNPDEWPEIPGMAFWEWIIPAAAIFFSREWQRILQNDDDGILGPNNSKWWPLVHTEDLDPLMDAARDIAENRTELYQTLRRVRRGDGTWVWLLSRGHVTERQGGKPVKVMGTICDVSTLRSDVKFQHGSQTLDQGNALFARSPDLIVRMDRQLDALFNNPQVARYLTSATVLGQADPDAAPFYIPPEQLDFFREKVTRVFDTGISVREIVTFPTKYGHAVTGEYSFWPEYDPKGRVLSVLTQFRDLTEQILAERRASLNEMRLEALYRLTQMDSAPREDVLDFVMESLVHLTGSEAGVLFFPVEGGEDGRAVWSRDLQARVAPGILPRTRLPADLFSLLVDDGGTARRRLANGNGLFPLHQSLNGALDIMRFISAPVFDRDHLVCIAAVINKESLYYEDDLQQLEAFIRNSWLILRRHMFVQQLRIAKEDAEKANEELKLAKEIAENANKVKDSFLANVSHELRTPLNGILSMLQLLEGMPLSPRQREYVETAAASGRSLVRIVSDILDFSRMQTNSFELHCEKMDLGDTVRSSLKLFQQEAEHKGLEFSFVIDEAIPALVHGDDARVRQVIFNLVGNALKFTEKGGITVTCSPLPARNPEEILVRLSVEDTGIGIPPALRDTIFESFTQLANSSSQKTSGTGLGLAIIKRIIDLMGGSIEVESELGVGTAVHCTLRFAKTEDSQAALETAGPLEEEITALAMDILIAEDDPTSSFALRAFLQQSGHRVVCVENGRQALEALQLHPFHCLFTDILMPCMDGLELIARIREQNVEGFMPAEETRAALRAAIPGSGGEILPLDSRIPAVSVSAHAMAGDQEKFLNQGMDYYIAKPIIVKELHAILALIAKRLAG